MRGKIEEVLILWSIKEYDSGFFLIGEMGGKILIDLLGGECTTGEPIGLAG